jgi:hypothetical protein
MMRHILRMNAMPKNAGVVAGYAPEFLFRIFMGAKTIDGAFCRKSSSYDEANPSG